MGANHDSTLPRLPWEMKWRRGKGRSPRGTCTPCTVAFARPFITSTRCIIRRLTYLLTHLLTYPSPHQRDASSAALRTYLLTYSYPSLRQRGASSAALRTYFLTYLLTELRARGTCIPCTVAFARTFIAPLKPIICSAMEFPATSMECRACRFERSALALDLERRPVSTSMSSSRSRRTSRRV